MHAVVLSDEPSTGSFLPHFEEKGEPRKPHIILVMADDQGWGDTGYNGHPFVQTPELNSMAKDGFVFDRFYAAAPVCSPTRASVMTGRHPIRTKVTNHGRYMRPHEQTLAETLKASGYVTGIFGKVHLGSGQPDSPCNPSGMGFDEWVIGLNFFDNDPYLSRNGIIEHRKGKGSVIAMDDALAFLGKHKDRDQPIFAVIWFPSPHDPHQEVPDGPTLYDGEKQAGYYREITLLDQQVGRLRRELKGMGIADNTLLWYCSDNGGLAEASSGGRSRKGSIYEGGLRIPSIIEWPTRSLSGRTAVPAWTCDMYPTLLAMAGIKGDFPHLWTGWTSVASLRVNLTAESGPWDSGTFSRMGREPGVTAFRKRSWNNNKPASPYLIIPSESKKMWKRFLNLPRQIEETLPHLFGFAGDYEVRACRLVVVP